LAGRVDEALPLLREVLEQREARGDLVSRPFSLGGLSQAYLSAGRVAQAGECAQRALDLARGQTRRGAGTHVSSCLWTSSLSPDTHEQVETAEAHYRQAMALATELGWRPVVAHCHLGLGMLHRRTGRREQAHEHLTTATTMYREMGMTCCLEQAEAEKAKA